MIYCHAMDTIRVLVIKRNEIGGWIFTYHSTIPIVGWISMHSRLLVGGIARGTSFVCFCISCYYYTYHLCIAYKMQGGTVGGQWKGTTSSQRQRLRKLLQNFESKCVGANRERVEGMEGEYTYLFALFILMYILTI